MNRCLRILLPALVVAFGASQASAEPAQAKPSTPLDIMKFMREQAASTRVGEQPHHVAARRSKSQAKSHARPHAARLAAHASHHRSSDVASASPETPLAAAVQPADIAAPQDEPSPSVQVVASDEFNAIDATAPAAVPAAPTETIGAASAADPQVHMVAAQEFNAIDRMASDVHAEQSKRPQSWMQWIWSTLGSTFTALASAVHNLIG